MLGVTTKKQQIIISAFAASPRGGSIVILRPILSIMANQPRKELINGRGPTEAVARHEKQPKRHNRLRRCLQEQTEAAKSIYEVFAKEKT